VQQNISSKKSLNKLYLGESKKIFFVEQFKRNEESSFNFSSPPQQNRGGGGIHRPLPSVSC